MDVKEERTYGLRYCTISEKLSNHRNQLQCNCQYSKAETFQSSQPTIVGEIRYNKYPGMRMQR